MSDQNEDQSNSSKTSLQKEKSVEKSLEDTKKRQEIDDLIRRNPAIAQLTSINFKETESHPVKPVVRCKHDIRMRGLVRDVFNKQWKLNSPRIVVLIMSNVRSVRDWTNAKQIKSFQKGLMNAAENTNMWLITNGIDMGPTSIIGNAIADYIAEAKYKSVSNREKPFSKFNFIGIADEDMVKYLQTISSSNELKVDISAESMTYTEDKYRLNQNLSHYILVKDDTTPPKNGLNIFLQNLTQCLAFNQTETITPSSEDMEENVSIEINEIPVVSIIINGGYGCARLVLEQIKNKFPVVVLKGSGGLADLLAYVELEIRDRSLNKWDEEFENTHLKPELRIRINELFPQYRENVMLSNNFRQNILDAVQKSRSPNGQVYLTVVNMFETYTCKLENLTEVLLSALFKTQQTVTEESTSKIQAEKEPKVDADTIRRDLSLCVDWNCPEVAKKEVLTKDPTFSLNEEKKRFEESLIRNNRCEFVDLFLTQKFRLRTFLSPKRLKRMFRRIHSNDFFMTVCWESILGRSREQRQTDHFIYRGLNWLMEACTGNSTFFDESELNLFMLGQFPDTEREAERKSLEIITLWAILHFRKRLVRILWSHSDQPITLALIIALSYERISWYVSEQSLNEGLKAESKQFVSFALSVLDKCYKESPNRSENILNESSKDWNYKTAVDLAAFGRFKDFLSHPSCQRWLTNKFYGNIAVKDYRHQCCHLPALAKILMSAYVVAPIYWWIRITNLPQNDVEEDIEDDEEEDPLKKKKRKPDRPKSVISVENSSKIDKTVPTNDVNDSKIDISPIDGSDSTQKAGSSSEDSSPSPSPLSSPMASGQLPEEVKKPKLIKAPEVVVDHEVTEKLNDKKPPEVHQPPIFTLIYEVWTAPITKFWNFQFFYTFYLSVFSVALLYPRCGNLYLDLLISVWTALIIVDDCRQAYILSNSTNPIVSIPFRFVGIAFKSGFWLVFTLNRLFIYKTVDLSPYQDKVLMSLALLQAFYVLLSKFLPISATLGPLLYRLQLMLFVDFVNFLRLSILVMISFGVIIQAIIYPDLSINNELFRKAFHRAFFSLFLTPADELLEDPNCVDRKHSANTTEEDSPCSASIYSDETCRVTGFWPYIFMICYFILLKLILLTLLYALFASSTSTLTADTDSIWKFQRYGLVMDFISRQPLPPPLNVFYYGYLFFDWVQAFRHQKRRKNFMDFQIFDRMTTVPQTRLLTDDEYNYFRHLASETFNEFQNQKNAETMAALQWERLEALGQETEYQRQTLRQLRGKVSEMDRNQKDMDKKMEEIYAYIKTNIPVKPIIKT